MAERSIVQARESFACTLKDGTPFQVVSGDRFWDDDPLVASRAHLFGELTVRTSLPSDRSRVKAEPKAEAKSADDTETADATPGTRRSVSSKKAAG
jgi:hypothetical protein